MNKKKILLVCDGHLHIAMEYYKLLTDNYKVDIYWSIKYKKKANYFLKKKTKFFTYPQGLIYFFLFFKSFKYDHIFLVTGPQEFNRFKGLIGIFGYLIFVFCYGKKTIMGIRNNNKYFLNNNENFIGKILNFIRHYSLLKIFCVFFETKTLMRNFKMRIKIKNLNCLAIYPLHFVNNKIKPDKLKSNILRIGLVGAVNEKNRKNYKLFTGAMKLLDEDRQNKIEILLLGNVKNVENTAITGLKKKIKSKIIYQGGYIKEIKFKKLASSCHVLLSINNKNNGNSHKGTGSFFDAISSKKILITNLRSDRQFEFKNFCYYYSDKNQLTKILNFFLDNSDKLRSLREDLFTKYNNDQAKDDLIKLLC